MPLDALVPRLRMLECVVLRAPAEPSQPARSSDDSGHRQVLTFRLNYLVHELRPAGYHIVNWLLHAAVSVLVHAYARRLLPTTGDPRTGERAAVRDFTTDGFLWATCILRSDGA